jgi:hypothetical protein
MSEETKHSPEPWSAGLRDGTFPDEIDDATGFRCAAAYGHGNSRHPDDAAEANARRIVAAVNAVAGIPTEALEAGKLGEALKAAERLATACAVDGLYRYETRDVCDALRALGRLP